MSWLSGLAATTSPRRSASSRTCGLGVSPSGNHDRRDLLGAQHAEDVGLVLGGVDGPVQLHPAGALRQPGVVTGADGVEAERDAAVEHRGELDLLVAAQARVGRPAGGVLGHEVVDDVGGEAVGEVPDVEGDAEPVGRPAGVVGVLARAAAAGSGAERLRVLRQRQVHAGHVVARVDGPRCGHGRVDPAGHGGQHPHHVSSPARHQPGSVQSSQVRRRPADAQAKAAAARARATASGSAASRAATSAAEVLRPRENRTEDRASSSSRPRAVSTWLGRVTPAEQAEPAEQSKPGGVQHHQHRVRSAARGSRGSATPGSDHAGSRVPRSTAPGTAARTPATSSSPQRAQPGLLGGEVGDRDLDGGGEAGDGGDVEGARADVALLPAAVLDRGQRGAPGGPAGRRHRRGRPACAR